MGQELGHKIRHRCGVSLQLRLDLQSTRPCRAATIALISSDYSGQALSEFVKRTGGGLVLCYTNPAPAGSDFTDMLPVGLNGLTTIDLGKGRVGQREQRIELPYGGGTVMCPNGTGPAWVNKVQLAPGGETLASWPNGFVALARKVSPVDSDCGSVVC